MNLIRKYREELGWSQPMLVRKLIGEGKAAGIALPTPRSLKTMLSRWENEKVEPEPMYRRLLGRVFGENPDAFKATVGRRDDDFPGLLPRGVHAGLLGVYDAALAQYVMADNLHGPLAALSPILAHVRQVLSLCDVAGSRHRGSVLRMAIRYSEFTGWLYQDIGQLDPAMRWTDRALDISHELGDDAHASYTFMRKSNVASDAGDGRRAPRFANAALAHGASLSPHLRAVTLRQQANAFALLGQRDDAERAVDAALSAVDRVPQPPGTDLAFYSGTEYVEMEAATCWAKLGRPEKAVARYRRGLLTWPANLQRDRGLCMARLATAHASAGDIDSLLAAAPDAVALARQTSSCRTKRELQRLGRQLKPMRRDPTIPQLIDEVATLDTSVAC